MCSLKWNWSAVKPHLSFCTGTFMTWCTAAFILTQMLKHSLVFTASFVYFSSPFLFVFTNLVEFVLFLESNIQLTKILGMTWKPVFFFLPFLHQTKFSVIYSPAKKYFLLSWPHYKAPASSCLSSLVPALSYTCFLQLAVLPVKEWSIEKQQLHNENFLFLTTL